MESRQRMEAPVVPVTLRSDSPPSASVSWLAGGCAHAGDTARPLRGGGRGAAPSGRLLGPPPDVQRHAPTRARQSCRRDAGVKAGRGSNREDQTERASRQAADQTERIKQRGRRAECVDQLRAPKGVRVGGASRLLSLLHARVLPHLPPPGQSRRPTPPREKAASERRRRRPRLLGHGACGTRLDRQARPRWRFAGSEGGAARHRWAGARTAVTRARTSGDSRREATRGLTARERAPEHNLAGGEADQRLEGRAAEPAAAAAVGRARASARARRRAAPVEVVAQDAVSQLERVRRVRLGASLVKEAERVADVVQHKAGVARRLADAVRARESRRPRDRGFAAERRGTGGGLALSDELPVPSARDAERGSLACHIAQQESVFVQRVSRQRGTWTWT